MSKKTVTTTPSKRKRTTSTKATRSQPTKSTKARKKTTAAKTARKTKTSVTTEARHAMIAQTAYYLAEARGFEHGNDVADWLTAERQINARP